MRLRSNLKCLLIMGIVICLSSCTLKKKLIYFQGLSGFSSSDNNKNYTPILRTDDLLSILISSVDMDAVKPFNIPISQSTSSQQLGGYSTGTPSQAGYLIDVDGFVDFPVVGKVKLAGLDRNAATVLIKEKLSAYLTNPIVNIRILNYKVTVLGEVKNPGTFTIPNERITLPEALGIAGDLQITGVRNNILVIRDIDGKKTETRVDLTSKNLFSSPVYYLNQNDVVYVEPNRAKINSSVINPSNVGIIISAVSLIITVLALITR